MQSGPSAPRGVSRAWDLTDPAQLTFHLHDLVRVLDHLVLGLIPESMRPGLDQIQNLVSDIYLHLPLQRKEKREQKTRRAVRDGNSREVPCEEAAGRPRH